MNEDELFIKSLTGQTVIAFGAAGPSIPSVPMPPGYRRAWPVEVNAKSVIAFANQALKHALPIGKQQVSTVTFKDGTHHLVMALTEVHFDNHPARPKERYKAGQGPPFQHPGMSILVPDFHSDDTKVASTPDKWPHRPYNPFPTETPGTIHSQNIYAGDEGPLFRGSSASELIFQRALNSNNHQAILRVAQAFNDIGETAKAHALMQKLGIVP